MRLVAQTKLGFYPAHPEAVAECLTHLEVPEDKLGDVRIMDPCCGEGEALGQIADTLGIPAPNVYAVELDMERARLARTRLGPDANLIVGSYPAVRMTRSSIGLAWVNPPFDFELGGGRRMEQTFAEKATVDLRPGGIMALVMPLGAIEGNVTFQRYLDSWYLDPAIYAWPAKHRNYKEVVYFGKKRKDPDPSSTYLYDLFARSYRTPDLPVVGSDNRTWRVVPSKRPTTFLKTELTDQEIQSALDASPLNAFLAPPEPVKPKRPPMPLNEGHVALLLASGLLNGLLRTVDGYAIVVRGVSKKVERVAERKRKEDDKGVVTQTTTFIQVPSTEIVAIDESGFLATFGEKVAPPPADDATEPAPRDVDDDDFEDEAA